MASAADLAGEDVGNIVALEHVNLTVEDQARAADFYCGALGLTRDPYVDFGARNLWVNVGSQQFHLPTAERSQVLGGSIGLVLPDLELVRRSLGADWVEADDGDRLTVRCPWGNRFHVEAPSEAYGSMRLGIPYVEVHVAPGAAEKIRRFYETILLAPVSEASIDGDPAVEVRAGRFQRLRFREREGPLPGYDGHHIAIYLSTFSGPYGALQDLGLITRESPHEYRFVDIVDPDTGAVVARLEHEVRSLHHALYGRPLVNRTPGNPYSMTDGFDGYDIHRERDTSAAFGGRP